MKYDEVPNNLYEMYESLKGKYFPHLARAQVLLLAHKKPMKTKGNLALAKIIKPTDLIKYLSREEAPAEGYDYIILFDAKLLLHCEDSDIERVLRHELRHTFYDSDSKTPYQIVDHDFSDFYDEVELNKDDPGWAKRLSATVSLIHHQDADN